MGFSGQENWSGLPSPPPGDLPNPGIDPVSLMSPTLAGGWVGLGCGSQGDWLSTGLKRVFWSLGMGTDEDKAQPWSQGFFK